ncbi:MAG: geranylgeranyl reductase family protein [Candidatus Asgardarchaeia archaeon]
MEYDLLVVGSGTGGSLAAYSAAKEGLNVLLVDMKPREKVGEKVCGDGIGRHHFEFLRLPEPRGEELERRIKGIDVFSPDRESVFRVGGRGVDGFIINRRNFGQRLLNMAIDAGAEFVDKVVVKEPIIKEGYVVGFKARKEGNAVEFYGKITVDASGMPAVIRRKLPDDWGIEKEIKREDIIIAYREIRELKEEIDEPEYGKIYLSQKIAPGGYVWIFPESGKEVNVGLGIQWLPENPHPRKVFYDVIAKWDVMKDSKVITGGGATVSTRHPITCYTGNGVMLVGDSACHVNPVHGGGIGPSMTAGYIAGKVAARAIEDGDVSKYGLWQYNIEFNKVYGAKQASLDVFRHFLQNIDDIDLNYGMKAKLMREEDVLKVNLGGDLKLKITEKARRLIRGIRRPRLILDLNYVANKMKIAKNYFLNYPKSPDEFPEWNRKVKDFFEKVREHFKRKTSSSV